MSISFLFKELHDFQGFLDIFSLLMTNEIKEGLASFFDIPEAKPDGKPISDNVAYCNLLKEKGIISSTHFDLFTTTMLECGQRSVAKIAHTLFSLFKEGKLGTPSLLKEEKGIVTSYILPVFLHISTALVRAIY